MFAAPPAAPLHQGRFGHSATRLASEQVLVAGGGTPDDILASAEVYDPLRNAGRGSAR